MASLSDQGVIITSSMDKSIKVWEMEGLLHTVHHIDRMELGVDKLVYCGTAGTNKVLAQTRNAIGIWNLETGVLERTVCENPR